MAGVGVVATPALAAGKVPAQFIAKMYTVALGRMPDRGGWSSYTNDFATLGCTHARVAQTVRGFYTSGEFLGRAYANAARVLALYRGALNREPDQAGFDHYRTTLDTGTVTWAQVVEAFVASGELANLVPAICGSATSYYYGTAPAPATPVAGPGTGQQLQALLDAAPAGATVYLAPMAVVRLTAMLEIPAGKALATTGLPSTHEYANQARLVRSSPFSGPMVRLHSGARLLNVWVDGQRGAYTNYTLWAINVQAMGGNGTEVSGAKISNSQGWSSLQTIGAFEGFPCQATLIAGNLITAYSSEHLRLGGSGRWTDGISVACENAIVRDNGIVDATDVGIVLFRASPAVQRSTVRDNQVLSAGNSAYGALGVDGLHSLGVTHDFTGSAVQNNAFWTGPDTHFDIGLAVGTRSWFGTLNDPGTGVSVIANHTNGFRTNVNTGIAVTGMHNATVQANDLLLSLVPVSACPRVNFGVDADGYATGGNFQPGAQSVRFTNTGGGGCVGH